MILKLMTLWLLCSVRKYCSNKNNENKFNVIYYIIVFIIESLFILPQTVSLNQVHPPSSILPQTTSLNQIPPPPSKKLPTQLFF